MLDTIRVFLIDDSLVEARWINQFFVSDRYARFNLAGSAVTLREGLEKLAETPIDLLILDLTLPDSDGVTTLLRTVEKFPWLPIVILTGTNDEELGMRLIQAGAQDYLVKEQVHPHYFYRTMRYAVERKREALERDKLVNELRAALAEVKQLSGLLPICAWCKHVRDDSGYWQQIEEYVSAHSDTQFSHGVCPDCRAKMQGQIAKLTKPPVE